MKHTIIFVLLLSLNACASPNITSKNGMLAFVGKQISIHEFKPDVGDDVILMDSAYKAKYRILKTVYGHYPSDVISFEVYDHYGVPDFSRYRYVLLFVSEHEGKIYHEKYQYFEVYKAKSGRWAFCGDPYQYEEDVQPKPLVNIEFYPPIEISTLAFNSNFVDREFPEPIYEHLKDKVVCKKGVYLEELFRIKKEGVLKNRGLFK